MEKQTKPVSTFHPEDGHRGTEEHETPGIVRRRYHAGHPDTSGENDIPGAAEPPQMQRKREP
jgi:hypothetical protein